MDLDAIRQRADNATPGPWEWDCAGIYYELEGRSLVLADLRVGDSEPEFDAEFIAHAREDVPLLLEALAVAQAEIETLCGQLEDAAGLVKRYHVGRPVWPSERVALYDQVEEAWLRKWGGKPGIAVDTEQVLVENLPPAGTRDPTMPRGVRPGETGYAS